MQDYNRSETVKPVPGDGTQDQKKTGDANWFGTSQEPQEEFVETTERRVNERANSASSSTGKPTMYGDEFGVVPRSGQAEDSVHSADEKPKARS